jgi:arabinose-5-phosphate isomerase
MKYISRAKDVIQIEIKGLERLSGHLDSAFDSAITLLLECLEQKGKIVLTGIGKNLPIAEKISATLASTGATSVVLNPAQAAHGDIGIVQPGDILIVISYSGASEELFTFIPPLKRNNIPIIGFTSASDSPLAEICDTVLDITVDQEACPFNIAPTASTTAALALGDAIAMVLLDARDIQLEDYARLHPGGAIGRTLLQRVSDIMRTGDQVASVSTDATIRSYPIHSSSAGLRRCRQ